jgi:hypothetical protein
VDDKLSARVVERVATTLLQRWGNATAGKFGLRRLGTGATDAAPGTAGTTLTTKGDVQGYSTTNARVPVGADNLPLVADAAQALGVKWAVLPVAGGGTGQATAEAGFNALAPTTTKGDIVARSTTNARLPVGSDGQVLTADAAAALGVKWATPAAASGDVTGPPSSVDSEVAIFSGTTGKVIKRAAATGIAKLASGVLSAVTTWAAAGLTGTASHVATFDAGGLPTSKAVGTGAGTVAAGDDSRFLPAAPARVLAQFPAYLPGGTLGWVAAHDAVQRRWAYYVDNANRSYGVEVTGSGGTFPAGDAVGYRNLLTTGAAAGNNASVRDNVGQAVLQPRHGAEVALAVAAGAAITTVLYWVAVVSTTFPAPAGSTLPGHGVGFRFATDSGDTTWIVCTRDGATQNTTDSGITVVAGNFYVFSVSTTDAGVTWRWRVYDVTAGLSATGTTTTNVPATTQDLGWACRVETRAASARTLGVYGVSGLHGARA